MKRYIGLSCVLIVCVVLSYSEENTIQKSAGVQKKTGISAPDSSKELSDTLVCTARLLEIPGTLPPNDLYNYVYVMKYRVITVHRGVYTEKELLVGHYNPRLARKLVRDKMDPFVNGDLEKFDVGAKHVLTLVTPIEKVWRDAVEDEYFDSELPRFFAITADIVK